MSVTGKNLKEWGLPHGPAYKEALSIIDWKGLHRKQAQRIIKDIVKNPSDYLDDGDWCVVAKLLMPKVNSFQLNESCCDYKVYGEDMIEKEALEQLYRASRLPVSRKAALMPDGHAGYGLPIGGVLATEGVVIPYAVGVDIGCRMHMTIFDIDEKEVRGMHGRLKNVLMENTVFGAGHNIDRKVDHEVLDNEAFQLPRLQGLQDLAVKQIGTSGGGNHFAEFGIMDWCGGKRLALLSHSGSRGVGYKVANIYTEIAMKSLDLPKEAKHLSWLSLDTDEGKEYWEAMNMCGDFAKACHEVLHSRIANALKAEEFGVFQNHHNFAWMDWLGDGTEVVVHRKGATPAYEGCTALVPGSMTTNSYLVCGLGEPDSLFSCSHGAGRRMSRKAAKESFTLSQMKKDLLDSGVELLGGGLDECSMAYKDIDKVMEMQKDLVEIKGTFRPFLVRMADEEKKPWQK